MKLDIKQILDANQIKAFCEKNKTMLILGGVLIIMLILASYLFFANNKDLSDGFETQIETNATSQEDEFKMQNPFSNQNKEQTPPPLNQEPSKIEQNNTTIPPLPPQTNKVMDKSEAIILEKDEPNIPDLSQNSFAQSTQADAIKEIAKKQKPKDMVEFLSEIKDKIELKKHSFKYDYKEYERGDKFLDFYEIEDIGENYIRFKDEEYSYNLRFIGENNE
ncbi:hypothetical protein [Campylobacter helveticus]|uniref:hypothetical protein n=1 Tax=Campylobacter helveticus TaxID=28898 RepID=UPI00111188BA|nr:hypothetical protein [Campylobacter helveticus]TNB56728.1 hypothetical protein FDW44_07850 [Campylobacter helveticus]